MCVSWRPWGARRARCGDASSRARRAAPRQNSNNSRFFVSALGAHHRRAKRAVLSTRGCAVGARARAGTTAGSPRRPRCRLSRGLCPTRSATSSTSLSTPTTRRAPRSATQCAAARPRTTTTTPSTATATTTRRNDEGVLRARRARRGRRTPSAATWLARLPWGSVPSIAVLCAPPRARGPLGVRCARAPSSPCGVGCALRAGRTGTVRWVCSRRPSPNQVPNRCAAGGAGRSRGGTTVVFAHPFSRMPNETCDKMVHPGEL